METAMRNVTISDRKTPLSPIIKTEAVIGQDQPLDFSKRVRHSLIDDDHMRKVSEDSAVSDLADKSPSVTPTIHSEIDSRLRSVGEPRAAVPSITSFLPQATLAGMGMFYPGAPVFPNFMATGLPPMWPNPMAAAMMQQHQEAARKFIQHSLNSKNSHRPISSTTRPFLSKDNAMLPGASIRPFPVPLPSTSTLLPTNGSPLMTAPLIPDPNILAEALKSHEEMYSAYKQQILSQKAAEEAKRSTKRQPSSTVTNGQHPCSSDPLPTAAAVTSYDGGETSDDNSMTDHILFNRSQSPTDGMGCHSPLHPDSLAEAEKDSETISHENSIPSTSTLQTMHSSDESIPSTSEDRQSLTPSHSSCGDLTENNAMRPRSSTLPTQSDSRLLSYSPAPSHMTNSNNSSGPGTPNSKNSFRKRARTLPDDQKDEAYWERRRKNNEAAKRSRDSRRAKEDEIALRAAFLEQENLRLRVELAALRQQTAKLRNELIIMQGPEEGDNPTDST